MTLSKLYRTDSGGVLEETRGVVQRLYPRNAPTRQVDIYNDLDEAERYEGTLTELILAPSPDLTEGLRTFAVKPPPSQVDPEVFKPTRDDPAVSRRNDPLELVLGALTTNGETVRMFVDGSEFAGLHVEPGDALEFDRTVAIRIIGAPTRDERGTHVPEMDNPMPPKVRIFADRDGTVYAQSHTESLWLHVVPNSFPEPNTPCGMSVSKERIERDHGPLRELHPAITPELQGHLVDAWRLLERADKLIEGLKPRDKEIIAALHQGEEIRTLGDQLGVGLVSAEDFAHGVREFGATAPDLVDFLASKDAPHGPVYCGNGPDFATGGLIPRGITAEQFDAALECVRAPKDAPVEWHPGGPTQRLMHRLRAELFGPESEPAPTEPGLYLAKDGATWLRENPVGGTPDSNANLAAKPWLRVLFPNGRMVPRTIGLDWHLSPEDVAEHGPFTKLTPQRGGE